MSEIAWKLLMKLIEWNILEILEQTFLKNENLFAYPVRLTQHLHTRRSLMCVNISEFREFVLVEMFALKPVNKKS